MKTMNRWIGMAVLGVMLTAATAFAGECCKQAAADTKAGKACAACLKDECCKDASKKVADKGEAKPCEKCAAKKNEKKS